MNICVVGGGVAGCMASVMSAKNGAKVVLFEKNEKLLKKMFITGKGRCNLTNYVDNNEFMQNVVSNPKFLFSSLNEFDSYSTFSFFCELGVDLKIERGNRVFPQSDKSSDITRAFEKCVVDSGVVVKLKHEITSINAIENSNKFQVVYNNKSEQFDKVIIACGGVSYKATGSTGDGYKFAKKFEHSIVDVKPGLVGLVCDGAFYNELAGLTLKNVQLNAYCNNASIYSQLGEMLFTHNGISGPIVLSLSSYINRKELGKLRVEIDLKPALSKEELDARICRDFLEVKNKNFKNSLNELLPKSMIPIVVSKSGIDENKQVNSITVEERAKLCSILKGFPVEVVKLCEIDTAIITAGGVSTSEINPKTMESKKQKGLYFAGEVLDVDALTGGFNIQIALSTGYAAGLHASRAEKTCIAI